jgi:hypothetical protein
LQPTDELYMDLSFVSCLVLRHLGISSKSLQIVPHCHRWRFGCGIGLSLLSPLAFLLDGHTCVRASHDTIGDIRLTKGLQLQFSHTPP